MATKSQTTMPRSDADLQAIQTSVAFKNISDAVEQYRRQFGLAFLALVAFSAIHVGLVVIANLYTMQTRVEHGVLTAAGGEQASPVGTAASNQVFDLAYIMTNMEETDQVSALENMKTASFVDKTGNYRQYTVTGFQLGGWKRSELKLFTSVGHVLEYVRGKGIRVFSEAGNTTESESATHSRHLLKKPKGTPTSSGTATPTYATWTDYKLATAKAADNMQAAGSGLDKKTVYVVDFLDETTSGVTMQGGTADVTSMMSATGLSTMSADADTAGDVATGIGYVDAFVKSFVPAAKTEIKEMYDSDWTTKTSTWTNMVETAFASPGALPESVANTYISAAVETGLAAGLDTAEYMDEITSGGLKAEYEKMYSEWYANGFTGAPTSPTTLYPTSPYVLEGMAAVVENAKLTAAIEAGTFSSLMMPSQGSLKSIATEAGGFDALAYGEITAMLTTIEASVTSLADGFSTYKATGWLGSTTASTATSTLDTSKYACTGMTPAQLAAYDTDLQVEAESACGSGGDGVIGGYYFSAILGTFEAFLSHVPAAYCTEVNAMARKRNLLAGWGSFTDQEMHMVYMLHGWGDTADWLLALSPFVATLQTDCQAPGSYTAISDPSSESASSFNSACADANFILVCPEDGASPFGGKTWYRNNMFTGYHMDMIVYELPWHIADTYKVEAITKNIFGFSMGAFGTVSMQMTYSTAITSSASFNAPVDAIECFYANVCHLECGISSLMCELLWTSIESALNPYVLVKSGHAFQTTGFYDPVAIGNAEKALKSSGITGVSAACLTGAGQAASIYGVGTYSGGTRSAVTDGGIGSMAWTGSYGEFANGLDQGIMGDFHSYGLSATCTAACPGRPQGSSDTCAFGCMDIELRSVPWSGVSYFWLDPIYFTMSSSHFAPTHNPLTGAMAVGDNYVYYTTDSGDDVSYWASYFNQLPYQRLYQNLDMFRAATGSYIAGQQVNAIYMFLGCDSNDEFGLADLMNEFMIELQALPVAGETDGIKGAWLYETSESHGHSFTETDCKLALQWFTETSVNLRTCVSSGGSGGGGGARHLLAPMEDVSCSGGSEAGYDTGTQKGICGLRNDEMSVQGMGGHLDLEGYTGSENTGEVCSSSHVGRWNDPDGLDKDEEIKVSFISWAISEGAKVYKDEMDSVTVSSDVDDWKSCVMSGYTNSDCPSSKKK